MTCASFGGGSRRFASRKPAAPASRRATVILAAALTAVAQLPASAHDVASGLDALNHLCRATIDARDYDEAQRICKRISFDAEKMAPRSQAHITSLLNLGDIKARVENFVDADAYYSAALQIVERTLGPQSEAAADILAALVEFKVRRGKYLDAAELAKRSLAIREKTAGANDVRVAVIRARYADLLSQSHQFLQAEAVYHRAIAVLERSGAESAETYARTVQHLGEMYERRAQFRQAEQQYRRVVDIAERNALSYRLLAGAFDRLAYVCEQQDRIADAALFYRRALKMLSGTPAPPELLARLQAQLAALEAAPPRRRAARSSRAKPGTFAHTPRHTSPPGTSHAATRTPEAPTWSSRPTSFSFSSSPRSSRSTTSPRTARGCATGWC